MAESGQGHAQHGVRLERRNLGRPDRGPGLRGDGDDPGCHRRGRERLGSASHDGGHSHGKDVLPGPENPPTFDLWIVFIGMVVHFVLSVALAMVLAAGLVAMRAGLGTAIAVGAAFGLLVYLVNFYGFTALFTWFENARNWITIASHLVFGVVAGGSYVALAR